MADKKAPVKKAATAAPAPKEQDFVFGKENYMMMAAGVVVIFIGFALMSGKEDIFSSTKLTVAPVVVVLGFIVEAFAVMYKTKE